MSKWFNGHVQPDWMELRARIMRLLQDESELDEIVKLVGMDALSAPDRLKLEAARSIREDFLHQDAFHEVDTFTPLQKQYIMMELVLAFYDRSVAALEKGAPIDDLVKMPVRERIGRYKYTPAEQLEAEYNAVFKALEQEIEEIVSRKEEF